MNYYMVGFYLESSNKVSWKPAISIKCFFSILQIIMLSLEPLDVPVRVREV